MASPQKENGFTPIANEIMEQIVNTCLLGSEYQILFWILRKTYGFQKKNDWISLTQFEKATKLSRPTVVKSLKNLVNMNIIIKSNSFDYHFNKDYEKWVVNTPLLVKYNNKIGKHALTDTSKHALTHKRNYQKKTKENTFLTKSPKNMKTLNYDTNEYEEEKPKSNKRTEVISLALMFDKMASDYTGKPIITPRSYFIVLNAINTHKMKPKGIEQIFKDWFNDSKIKKEEKVNLSFALSAGNINAWKTKN